MVESEVGAVLPTDVERPFLILVSSLGPAFREYFLESLAPRYRVWLFVGGPGRAPRPSWELPYVVGHSELDTQDPETMIIEARRLDAEFGASGLICYDESRVVATAETAAALGLPTSPPDAVRACRDKHLTRRALAAAGVPQPGSRVAGSVEQAAEAAAELGYPVVLKPRSMAASFGVSRVDSAEELAAAYDLAMSIDLAEERTRSSDGALVEEFLDGPEISVDAACFAGRVVPLAVAHKDLGYAPFFEEVGHLVDGGDPLFTDPGLLDVLTRAHAAVGFDTGMTHTELRRAADGQYKVIEINARLGGGLIPYLGQLATGVDLSLVGAAISCGEEPDLTRGATRVAAIRFYYPEPDMTVSGVQIDDAALSPHVVRTLVMAEPGQELLLPPRGSSFVSRLAAVVAVADDAATCRTALETAGKAITPIPMEKDGAE